MIKENDCSLFNLVIFVDIRVIFVFCSEIWVLLIIVIIFCIMVVLELIFVVFGVFVWWLLLYDKGKVSNFFKGFDVGDIIVKVGFL